MNIVEICAKIREQLEGALNAEGYKTDFGASNVSESCYVYVFEGEEEIKIRIAAHDVKNPASASDFHIGINQPLFDANVKIVEVFERMIWDEETDECEYVECEENDDEAESAGFKIEHGDIEAIDAAVKFVKAKFG